MKKLIDRKQQGRGGVGRKLLTGFLAAILFSAAWISLFAWMISGGNVPITMTPLIHWLGVSLAGLLGAILATRGIQQARLVYTGAVVFAYLALRVLINRLLGCENLNSLPEEIGLAAGTALLSVLLPGFRKKRYYR